MLTAGAEWAHYVASLIPPPIGLARPGPRRGDFLVAGPDRLSVADVTYVAALEQVPLPRRSIDEAQGNPWMLASTGQVRCPIVHEPTSALEQVCASIGCLDPVLYHMRQGRLDDLARMIRFLGRPVPEA